jgi:tetratricopeptide (TPR) repeat protein
VQPLLSTALAAVHDPTIAILSSLIYVPCLDPLLSLEQISPRPEVFGGFSEAATSRTPSDDQGTDRGSEMSEASQLVEEFASQLCELREHCGTPSLARLVELSADLAHPLARATISDKLNGKSLPSWDFVLSFVTACLRHAERSGVCDTDEQRDMRRWDDLHLQLLEDVSRSAFERRHLQAARRGLALRRANVSLQPVVGTPVSDPAPVVPRQLPPDLRVFAGREDELAILTRLADEAATSGGTVVITAIEGTAGIGKTALAVHLAHQKVDAFPDGQLYVNLRGFDAGGLTVNPSVALRGFLDDLAVPPDRIPDNLDGQAALYRSLIASRRMLVVLDNARDPDHVRPLLPGAPHCLVLVTSRNRMASLVAREGAGALPLDLLSDREAWELLGKRIGDERVNAEPEAVTEIITLCARLPLALAIVAARAVLQDHFPLAALADELRSARRTLDALSPGDPNADVRVAFSWSYDKTSHDAARLFRLLGLHGGPDIGVAAAAALADVEPHQARRLLMELSEARLLDERGPARFSTHDLLRAYASELVQETESSSAQRAAARRLLDFYLATAHAAMSEMFPLVGPIEIVAPADAPRDPSVTDYETAWAWFETEHRVLLTALDVAAAYDLDEHLWQLAWGLQDYFRRRGLWHEWASSQEVALTAAFRLGDPLAQAHCHHGIGRATSWLGRYQTAEKHFETALRIFAEHDDQLGQAHAQLDFAQMYSYQGRPQDAVPHATTALALAREAGDLRVQAKALNNGGWYAAQLGDGENALELCQQGLTLFIALEDRRGQSNTLDSVGYAHALLGNHEEALQYYERSLVLRRELGDLHGEAATLTHVGDSLEATGDLPRARSAWQDALIILEELGHTDALEVADKLARANATATTTPPTG